MPYGLTSILNEIPQRTREWVHQHVVPDITGDDNKQIPAPANRRERRALARAARRAWYPGSAQTTEPYTKEA